VTTVGAQPEPVHDVARRRTSHRLESIFNPATVAVIGAREDPASVGGRLLKNLASGALKGRAFPVNPAHASVQGLPAFRSIEEIPERVDLAVIATPAPTVPDIVSQCASAGVKGAIVISAGFRETGAAGAALEQQILIAAGSSGMRIIGPNCLGVQSPGTGLNATFAEAIARPGNVAFASQSGALCTAILDWSLAENFGFSRFVSTGSMLDVGWGDLIDFLNDDRETTSIVLYMESVGDPRAFISAVREVALLKPVIIIKAGRSEATAKAAASHTGALAGSDAVFDAVVQRCGALRVDTIEDLFLMSEVLAKQPRPTGKRLAILTNAGGPAVLAADALIAGGGELAPLDEKSLGLFNEFLPGHWSRNNPVDILGDADADRYARALDVVRSNLACDGVLVIFAPQGISRSADIAARIVRQPRFERKPILASFMGAHAVDEGRAILERAGIPVVQYPDAAARLFNYMWRYDAALQALYETPTALPASEQAPDRVTVRALIELARTQRRTLLSEAESKALLAAYAIPVVPTKVCAAAENAVEAAKETGFPVAVKLHSLTVTHKSDIGGVVLDVRDEDGVRHAFAAIQRSVSERAGVDAFAGVTVQPMVPTGGYELILGSSADREFGPVLLFGLGGTLVEVFRDSAMGLPPLNTTLARRMMERTRIYAALKGTRGRPAVDLPRLEALLVQFAALVVEQPWVKEIDINPLLASADRLLALDARVVLHDPATPERDLPRPAIRPYPAQFAAQWCDAKGTLLELRPIRPEDEPLMRRFHETLSETTVYRRYAHVVRLADRVAHDALIRACFLDYDRHMALVALPAGPGPQPIVGVGRLIKSRDEGAAEFALAVSDGYQRRGIGTELLRRLVDIGRVEGVRRIIGYILSENGAMLKICKRLGFKTRCAAGDTMQTARLDLQGTRSVRQ
jgi:acetyltransferase